MATIAGPPRLSSQNKAEDSENRLLPYLASLLSTQCQLTVKHAGLIVSTDTDDLQLLFPAFRP